MEKPTPVRPSVFEYLDYREFLRDLFAWLKQHDRSFSLRSLRIPRAGDREDGYYSAQFISLVLRGERPIPEPMIEGLARAFRLNDDETRFFERLVRYTRATDPEEKRDAFERLAWRSEFRTRHGLGSRDRLAFITRGYIGDIYLLTALPDFRAEAAWLSERLLYPLRQSQIDDAIALLCDLELIRLEDDGRVVRCDAPRPEPDAGEAILFRLYHQEQCDKAKLALDQLPPAERRFATWGLSGLRRADVPAFFRELEAGFAELLARLAERYDDPSGDTVAQINLQCFPVNLIPGPDGHNQGDV
ncbi:MAG: TIGR02147 family protein [Candidatus Dadabacteria bacterium]|nr:MAG: TIGR02147 family protein [Candidatus Dadabacteria bacterium]